MQSAVTNRQMALLLFVTITTTSVVTVARTMAMSAGHGAWITLLMTSLVYGVMAVMIVRLNRMYEGKTLFEYSGNIIGKAAPYIFGAFYLPFFYTLSVYYCFTFDELIMSNFLFETPMWALLLVGMPLYGFIAYKGLRNAGRLAEIIGTLFLTVAVTVLITMLIEGKWSYILPLFNPSDVGKYFLAGKDAVEQFFGIEILLFIPFAYTNKNASKTAFFTLLCIGLFYIIDVYGCYAMIGMDEIKYHRFPLVDAMRLVEYPRIEFLQRIDVAYQTIGFMRVIVAKAVVYLVIVELSCKLLPNIKRLIIVIVTGVIIFVTVCIVSPIPDMNDFLVTALSYASIVAVFIIPLILIVVSKVKRDV